MEINVAARVDIGLRKTNDDRVLALGTILDDSSCCGEDVLPAVAAVCDGCGGYLGGGVAAGIVLKTLGSIRTERISDPFKLASALDECRRRVMLEKENNPRYSQMCTTIAGVLLDEDKTLVFHSGDSRVYRFDGKYLARMTVDHSAVQAMIDCGVITEKESETAENKNVITRCIGIDCPPPDIYISDVGILEGETYLICSDGFWGSVTDKDIIRILSGSISDMDKANELVELALSNGSRDNVSVCLCSRSGSGTLTEETSTPFVLD